MTLYQSVSKIVNAAATFQPCSIPISDPIRGCTIVTNIVIPSGNKDKSAHSKSTVKSQANDMSLIMHYTFIPLFYIAMQAYNNTTQCHRHEPNSFSLT